MEKPSNGGANAYTQKEMVKVLPSSGRISSAAWNLDVPEPGNDSE